LSQPVILQIGSGSEVSVQLAADPPASLADGRVVLEHELPDPDGNIGPPSQDAEIVLSVPSPEELRRDPDQVKRVIAEAGTGTQPLVIVLEAAEELRDEELAPVLEAAPHTDRAVIVRIIRDG
jgi:hypothetical protein